MAANWILAAERAAEIARWAVTMSKVRIRTVKARTKWQFVTFLGKTGAESAGIVDVLAVRKDHHNANGDLKRGDGLQIVLIQVKGGGARKPSPEDIKRLRAVARRYHAEQVLLATWKKGKQPTFFKLAARRNASTMWAEVEDLRTIFR